MNLFNPYALLRQNLLEKTVRLVTDIKSGQTSRFQLKNGGFRAIVLTESRLPKLSSCRNAQPGMVYQGLTVIYQTSAIGEDVVKSTGNLSLNKRECL